MSLITRCPKCHSDFVVKLEQLQALDGLVRCGTCAHIFDGFATLESQLPTLTQRPGAEPAVPAVPLAPAAEPAVLRHRLERSESFERREQEIPEPAVFTVRADSESSGAILGESRLRGDGPSVGRTQPEFLVDEDAALEFGERACAGVARDSTRLCVSQRYCDTNPLITPRC